MKEVVARVWRCPSFKPNCVRCGVSQRRFNLCALSNAANAGCTWFLCESWPIEMFQWNRANKRDKRCWQVWKLLTKDLDQCASVCLGDKP